MENNQVDITQTPPAPVTSQLTKLFAKSTASSPASSHPSSPLVSRRSSFQASKGKVPSQFLSKTSSLSQVPQDGSGGGPSSSSHSEPTETTTLLSCSRSSVSLLSYRRRSMLPSCMTSRRESVTITIPDGRESFPRARRRSLSSPSPTRPLLSKEVRQHTRDDTIPPVFFSLRGYERRVRRSGSSTKSRLARSYASATTLSAKNEGTKNPRFGTASEDLTAARSVSGPCVAEEKLLHRRHDSGPADSRRRPTSPLASSSSSSSSASALSVLSLGDADAYVDAWKDWDTNSQSSLEELEPKGADWLYRQMEKGTTSDESINSSIGRDHIHHTASRNVFLRTESADERQYMDFSPIEHAFLTEHDAYIQSSALLFEGSASRGAAQYEDLVEPQCTFYSPTVGVVKAKRFQDFAGDNGHWLREQAKTGNFWIDVHRPPAAELALIAKVFGIHALTLEDILDVDIRREKCEAYNEYISLAVGTFDLYEESPNYLGTTMLWILVFPHCILTFHMDPLPQIPSTIQRLSRIHNLTERKFKHPHTVFHTAWVCYLLIDDVLDKLDPLVHRIEDEADQIEDLVLYGWEDDEDAELGTEMLQRMHAARKQNTMLLRLLSDKVGILKGVVKKGVKGIGTNVLWGDELGLYFESLQDRTIADIQRLKHFDEMLTRQYLEEISLCLNAASKRSGELARKMTAIVTLLVPVGALTGMMGINVKVPGQPDEDVNSDLTNFWFATALMVGLFGGSYVLAKRWRWFSD
ncbi:hypothetical protein PhCBS80983_g01897 [Powellomyces hirtus]|uniref:Magnesium transporter n=1 Tax=Powellomyces hirtus TaxID=109895 RepID=A0A507EAY1_9FUNG|nr:hypothetical protein PhCBS80983_g01897 [Powellomyces hirtus]